MLPFNVLGGFVLLGLDLGDLAFADRDRIVTAFVLQGLAAHSSYSHIDHIPRKISCLKCLATP